MNWKIRALLLPQEQLRRVVTPFATSVPTDASEGGQDGGREECASGIGAEAERALLEILNGPILGQPQATAATLRFPAVHNINPLERSILAAPLAPRKL